METRVTLWLIGLFVLVGYWFYLNSKLEIDYERHTQLVDQETGKKHKPSELLDLAKIIHPTPEYINSSNAIQRLYDLAYLSTFENPFVIDQSYSSKRQLLVSGWPAANQTRCAHQLAWILGQLAQHGNYSSLKGQMGYDLTNFMDSFGRPESGIYSGSIHWLGSYKNCLASSLNSGQIKTRYCIIKTRFKSWPKNETIYPLTRIRAGICLPETCDTLSYVSLKKQINRLAKFDLPDWLKDDLEMDALHCLPDERSPIRRIPTGGRVFLVVVGVWLAVVLAATVVYETLIRREQRSRAQVSFVGLQATKFPDQESYSSTENKLNLSVGDNHRRQVKIFEEIICGVSVRNSIKTFKTNTFRVRYDKGQRVRLNLGGLDFVKANMTLLVVLAHACYLCGTHMRSMGNRIESSTGHLALMAMTVARCVDTFFFFFGVLTSYNLIKKFGENQLSNPLVWIAVNLGILFRIGPMFMFVYWYSKLIAPYTSSGPWWDYGIDKTTIKGTCLSEPWWKSIPYLGGSGHPSVPACNLPSWFIVSYSQISLLMPLITYLICKLPGRFSRCLLVGLLSVASAGSIGLRLALQTTVREEGITLYGAFLADLLEKFESTGHLTTLGRLGTVSTGCLVGYLLRRYEVGEISSWPKWVTSKIVNTALLGSLVLMMFLPIIGRQIYLMTGRMATWTEFVATNMLMIIVWPIVLSILFTSWTTHCNHLVLMRFISHSFWHIFNRLGLCIFLIHWEVLYMVTTGFEQAPSHGFIFDMMKFWAFGVFFSLIFAFIIYILLEAPLSSLLMIVYRKIFVIPQAATPGQQQHRNVLDNESKGSN